MKLGMFIVGLCVIAAAFAYPVDQKAVNKSCVENGGYVSNYNGYIGCNIKK